MTNTHAALAAILVKVREERTQSNYLPSIESRFEAVMRNQERLAEGLVILATLMDTVVNDQLHISVEVPDETERN